jgi:hypothetical protein
MKCSQCGSTIPDAADYCAYCGQPKPRPRTPAPLEWIRQRTATLLVASSAFFLASCGLLTCTIAVQRYHFPMTLTEMGTAANATTETPAQAEEEITTSLSLTAKLTPTPILRLTATPKPSSTPTSARTATPTVGASPSVVEPSATPACPRSVAAQLASAWNRGVLGCPTGQAQVVWAAWQPFEQGNMFWSSDTRRVIVFYGDHTWAEFADQWTEGAPIPSRGDPPGGLLAPIRGFGYIWGTYDSVADGIGWATDQEKGFCVHIQRFEKGVILRSSAVRFCQDELYNWATHPSFSPLFLSANGDGRWQSW